MASSVGSEEFAKPDESDEPVAGTTCPVKRSESQLAGTWRETATDCQAETVEIVSEQIKKTIHFDR